jgi:hypothetical protein
MLASQLLPPRPGHRTHCCLHVQGVFDEPTFGPEELTPPPPPPLAVPPPPPPPPLAAAAAPPPPLAVEHAVDEALMELGELLDVQGESTLLDLVIACEGSEVSKNLPVTMCCISLIHLVLHLGIDGHAASRRGGPQQLPRLVMSEKVKTGFSRTQQLQAQQAPFNQRSQHMSMHVPV